MLGPKQSPKQYNTPHSMIVTDFVFILAMVLLQKTYWQNAFVNYVFFTYDKKQQLILRFKHTWQFP